MSSSKAGRRFENNVVGDLYEATGPNIHILPAGFSGNHRTPAGDVHVYDLNIGFGYIAELKRSSRETFPIREFTEDGEEVDQLTSLSNPATKVYIGMKFNRRELLMAEITDVRQPIESLIADAPDCFNPRYSEKSDTFRFDDPWKHDKDAWPSAQAGRSDIEVITDTFDIPVVND